MNGILVEQLDKCCVIYIDDVIIYSKTHEEHANYLNIILTELQENLLYAKANNCEITVEEFDFVGHWTTPHGISSRQSKVEAINIWRECRVLLLCVLKRTSSLKLRHNQVCARLV